MKALESCLENGKIGIFESPTGTGKSLSLICGALTWIKKQRSTSGPGSAAEQAPKICGKEPLWIQAHKRKRLEQDAPNVTIRIFYCSRTHTQLSQVIQELKKTGHASWARATPISSRRQACINDRAIQESRGSISRLNDICIDMQAKDAETGCPFYYYKDKESFSSSLSILDLEDLVQLGKSESKCPYYMGRDLLSQSHFIALPYQLILQKSARESLGIDSTMLSNSIIIFDEAHNLVDTIQDLFSVELSLYHIDRSLEQLTKYSSKHGSRCSDATRVTVQQAITICKKLSYFIRRLGDQLLLSPNDFLRQCELDHFNFFPIDKYIKEHRLAWKILDEKTEIAESGLPPLLSILDFCLALSNSDKEGQIQIIKNGDTTLISYILLHCSTNFMDLVQQARSVVLAGGTMDPIQQFLFQLFGKDKVEGRLVRFTSPHIISKDSMALLIQTVGPSNRSISLTWEQYQRNTEMLLDVGRAVSIYSKIVPHGLVVFFSSYAAKRQLIDLWGKSGILFENKRVFEEGEDLDISSYHQAAKTENGAILFAVMHGRLSEGINFSDESGRGVLVIGVPYPNIIESLALRERKSFSEKYSCSSNYLEDLCMTSVNQTIGRVIRHKDDYAVIILLDSRYRNPKLRDRLPTWMHPFIELQDQFDNSIERVTAFFKKVKEPGL